MQIASIGIDLGKTTFHPFAFSAVNAFHAEPTKDSAALCHGMNEIPDTYSGVMQL